MQLERVNDEAGFLALQPIWDSVWAKSSDRSPFTTWQWAHTWWAHFGKRDQLEILLANAGNEIVGLAAMLRTRLGVGPAAATMLVGIGQETADYGGLLLGERPRETALLFLRYLAEQVNKGVSVVNLTRLRPDGDTLSLASEFCDQSPGSMTLKEEESDVYPTLQFDSMGDPAADLRKLDVRNDVWRTSRRFAEHFNVEFDYDAEPNAGNLQALFDLSEQRWDTQKSQLAGLFAGARGRRFIADVVVGMRSTGGARLSLLHADERVVAARLGFECDRTYLGYKECFDPSFSKFGPGQLLVSRILHRMLENEASDFDFLRGSGFHKSKWANQERSVGYWTMSRPSRIGLAARKLMWIQLRLRLRRWSR